jgi:hypothetical protein
MSTGNVNDKKQERFGPPDFNSSETRLYYLIGSIGILIFITIGIFNDDLILPTRRGTGIHLHGVPAWLMFFAAFCAIANIFSELLAYYTKRSNKRNYRIFSSITQALSWTFFLLSIVLYNSVYHKA